MGYLTKAIGLFLITTIISAINMSYCANPNGISSSSIIEKFIPDDLMLENCMDSEIVRKISDV